MKVFSGFPAGKLQVTPLPDQFFTELCPAIDDLAELKVTLHFIWLLTQRSKSARSVDRRNRSLWISFHELRADSTLMHSLGIIGGKAEEVLAKALAAGVERGTLLHLHRDGEDLYFLNSEAGRRAFARVEQGDELFVRGAQHHEPARAEPRPNIFTLYEQNIGLLTPMISDELKEAEGQYPAAWIPDAFQLAVENNKRSWSYVRKILERWKTEGRGDRTKKKKPWYGDEYSKFVKR
jgi:DnaD/phage-associated family protein